MLGLGTHCYYKGEYAIGSALVVFDSLLQQMGYSILFRADKRESTQIVYNSHQLPTTGRQDAGVV